MTETLTMSKNERNRISILDRARRGTLTRREAAEELDLSERQLYRIQAQHRKHGDGGLIHKLRGQPSNRGRSPSVRKQVLALYRKTYSDYGPTLFCEELEKRHQIVLDSETARRWLMADAQWAGSRKKHPHRRKRPRREAIGDLVQFDGSPHDWFEGRGPACTLLHAIDDASNQTFLRLAPSENTIDCMRTMRSYIERYGIPRQLYVDYGSVFKDGKTRTQFERAMKDLGVDIVHAHSPQAKGRVERGNRTHQDRLIKAMRQAHISSIQEANVFLDREYHADHNSRFARTDGLPNVHRSIDGFDLDKIFCIHETRVVANDYTIKLKARYVQLLRSESPLPPPKRRVDLRHFLDGTLHIYWNDHELTYKHLDERPRTQRRVARPLGPTHHWRKLNARLHPRRRQVRTRRMIMTPP